MGAEELIRLSMKRWREMRENVHNVEDTPIIAETADRKDEQEEDELAAEDSEVVYKSGKTDPGFEAVLDGAAPSTLATEIDTRATQRKPEKPEHEHVHVRNK